MNCDMPPTPPDWLTFIADTVDAVSQPLGVVLSAWGCREGWLQGEFYRAGKCFDLRVNEYDLGGNLKADLSCAGDPSMVGEIKIIGADYQPKMRYAIEWDVRRLSELEAENTERFMVLIIPHSEVRGILHEFLRGCSFSDHCVEKACDSFTLRVWRLES